MRCCAPCAPSPPDSERCDVGLPIEGDGTSSSTFEIEGERGRLELRVAVDPETGALTTATLRERTRQVPAEGW